MRLLRKLAVFSALFSALAALGQTSPALDVSAVRQGIWLGESALYQVTLRNADDKTPPKFVDLPPGIVAEVRDSRSNSSTSITVINGKTTRDIRRERTFIFSITPKSAGEFCAGRVIASIDGREISALAPPIKVTGLEKRDDVALVLEPSQKTVLVDEPFSLTLKVRLEALPPPYSNSEPINPQEPPNIQAEFLDLHHEVPGLKPADIGKLFEEIVKNPARQVGTFTINNYQSHTSAFFGFGGMHDPFAPPTPLLFYPKMSRSEAAEKSFWDYEITLDYTPTAEGEYSFGPASLKGRILKGVDKNGRALFDEVFVRAEAITVCVVPPPEEGRPKSFIGSVGKNCEAQARFDTQFCKVGDPLTLSLEITGEISLSNMRPPHISQIPGITENFRVYDESVKSETIENGKRYSYRVRPLRAGTLEFPALPVAFFDTATRAYSQVFTSPLPLQVQATTQVAVMEVGGDEEWKSENELPDGIMISRVSSARGIKELALASIILPAAAFFLWFARALWRRRKKFAASWREKTRARRLRRELQKAIALAPRDAAEAARLGAAAWRLEGGEENANFAELAQIPFRPGVANAERTIELLKALKKAAGIIALAFLATFARGAFEKPCDEFEWEHANLAMAKAQSPEEFAQAADFYSAMLAEGARNGELLFNLATAQLLAGNLPDAQDNFVRAERWLGTAHVRRNWRLALGGDLPPSRTLLAPHFALDFSTRLKIALAAWCFMWLGVIFRRQAVIRLGMIAFLLYAFSVALTIFQELLS